MEALLGLVVAAACLACYWLGSRHSARAWERQVAADGTTLQRLDEELRAARSQVAASHQDLASAVERARQTQERHDLLIRDLLAAAATERGQLVDKLTPPPDPVLSEPLVGMGRKLHHTEQDEIEGTTPAKVAAAARAAA